MSKNIKGYGKWATDQGDAVVLELGWQKLNNKTNSAKGKGKKGKEKTFSTLANLQLNARTTRGALRGLRSMVLSRGPLKQKLSHSRKRLRPY